MSRPALPDVTLPRAFAVLPAGMPDPAGVHLAGRVDRFDLGAPLAVRVGVDVIVLSERLVDADDAWDAVRGLTRTSGAVIWVVADHDGINRHLWGPLAARVLDANGRDALDTRPPMRPSGERADASVVLVLGAKGGVGKTFVAANLAYFLATAGHRVSAVDLDVAAGDLALRLGMEAHVDLVAASRERPLVIPPSWVSAKRGLPLCLWAAIPRPEFAPVADAALTNLLLDAAMDSSPSCVVVDTPPDWTCPSLLAAIDRAHVLILVTTLSPGSVRQARTAIDLLKRLNIPVRDRLVLIANRVSRRAAVEPAVFRDMVGQGPQLSIADIGSGGDFEAYAGRPAIAARQGKRLRGAFQDLARAAMPGYPPESHPLVRRGRLLARMAIRRHGDAADSREERWI